MSPWHARVFGFREIFVCGIRDDGSWNLAYSSRNPEYHERLESRIQGSNDKNLACVAWRFWLGALSNNGGRGQRNREVFVFSRLRRSCARLDKTAMLRRLTKTGIQYLESGIHRMQSIIQDCLGFPYMVRSVTPDLTRF